MALTIGTQVGSHEIVALLGKGGMGEVYRARDLKLKREVAIKILPEEFARDADRVSRFQREAEVLASLNHPNIGGIHDFAEANGSRYLVLELVEGETLGDVIANRGALPVGGALQIGIQICEALEAAHEKGVIHRDLKPANIKVTPDGKVKVLDFGLAKAFEPQTARPRLSQSPTISMAATMQGVILGTAAYMSPEQAKGKEVDRRTDIFAFGAVLYEMLTGRPAFSGEDVADILSHVLRSEPDWTLLPANLPPAMQRLLRLCLQKDAKKRRQTATDVRIDIEQALAEPAAVSTTNGAAPQKRSIVPWVAFAVAMLVAVALAVPAVLHFREVPPVAPLISTSVIAPEGTAMEFGAQNYSSGTPALSPDGKWIVFGARTADNKAPLWIRPLSSNTAQMLPGTDGATFPFWSPENRYVAFFAGAKLKKIDITGGPPIAIADASGGRGGSWSPEGIILFTPDNNSPLFKVAAGGGTPKPATRVEATKSRSHRFPWFLPDGRHFLFEDLVTNQGVDVVLRIGSLDSAETMEIGPAGSNAVYSNGYLLFLREDTLMAQPFDPGKRTVLGEAVPVAERVFHELNNGRQGIFTVSISGLLAYQTEGSSGRVRLSWFDRTGKVVGSLGEPGDFNGLELSPDRRSAAVVSIDTTGNPDIWVYDIARNLPTRFTFDPGIDSGPVWSPNGTTIVWSNLTVARRLLRKSADLKGAEEVLYQDTGAGNPSSWSPDGKFLLFNKNSTGMGNGVGMLPLLTEKPGGPLKPTALVDTPFNESRGIFSPDGHWVVYQSNESRQYEIYVIPFPGPGGKRQISTTGGVLPRWRHDGKEIFYVGLDNKLMAAEVTLKATSVDVGEVHPLPITVAGDRIGIPYDVSLDGQRILAITVSERRSSTPLTLIQNWTALLKK